MMAMADEDDDYFNDLSRQPVSQDATPSRNAGENTSANEDDGNPVPRQKRMACVVCRKRKLKCDGKKPSCGTCARVGHNCAYDEVRKKSGPKRGYVKQLEARLAQVETLLKNHEPENTSSETNRNSLPNATFPSTASDSLPDVFNGSNTSNPRPTDGFRSSRSPQNGAPVPNSVENEASWEVISLGLEEALPTQEAMDELFDIYFKKVHPSIPMIHRPRFFAAMDLAPQMRPPVCLRYIMWAAAASITPKYNFLEEHFYARARKYIHKDEMTGHGESMVSIAHCQAWTIIGLYEFKQMYFPRAWMSVGRAARMAAMMRLHRLDGVGLDVKHCVPPPRDWVETEERRRTFWACFNQDRHASIGTGWPMTIDERDIMTNLPSSEEAFATGTAEVTPSLKDVLAGDVSNISPYGLVSVMAYVFGLNLTHLHRPDPQDRESDINGEFWRRHRTYDNILLNVALSLPQELRLPQEIAEPNVIFANMAIHTATICLHQAAIFKAEKHKGLGQIAAESKRRCIIAANQVTGIMKMISHTHLSTLNVFTAFNLYVAARVFVQYLKSRPGDQAVQSSLQFLLTALGVLKQFSALTESFMIQLDVDLHGTSFASSGGAMRSKLASESTKSSDCVPVARINPIRADGVTDENSHKDGLASHTSSPGSRGDSASSQNGGSTISNQKRPRDTARSDQQLMSNGSSGIFADVTRNSHITNTMFDNPSPDTLNSISNFTPPDVDHSSVTDAVKNMADPSLMDFSNGINGFGSQSEFSLSPFFDTSLLNAATDLSGLENSMPLNENWSASISQPAIPGDVSMDMMDDSNNFSDRQFDLLIRGMGWNGWDDQPSGH